MKRREHPKAVISDDVGEVSSFLMTGMLPIHLMRNAQHAQGQFHAAMRAGTGGYTLKVRPNGGFADPQRDGDLLVAHTSQYQLDDFGLLRREPQGFNNGPPMGRFQR